MPDSSDTRHIDALVKLGERDADPQVRLAALAAASSSLMTRCGSVTSSMASSSAPSSSSA